jgi:hypothetical protein
LALLASASVVWRGIWWAKNLNTAGEHARRVGSAVRMTGFKSGFRSRRDEQVLHRRVQGGNGMRIKEVPIPGTLYGTQKFDEFIPANIQQAMRDKPGVMFQLCLDTGAPAIYEREQVSRIRAFTRRPFRVVARQTPTRGIFNIWVGYTPEYWARQDQNKPVKLIKVIPRGKNS